MQPIMRIRLESGQALVIEPKSALFCLAEHPLQGDVGKSALLVPPAYVGMDPGEPHLLNDLVRRLPSLVPESGFKVVTEFVYREGVIGETHAPRETSVVEPAVGTQGKGPYRIPDANEKHGTRPAEGSFEPFRGRAIASRVVDLGGVLHEVVAATSQQTALVEHAGQRPHSECPTAKPKQEYFVAILIAVHQEAVGVLNVLL